MSPKEVWRPSDAELVEFVALRGARGLYSAAFDAGVDAVRADAAERQRFEDDLYKMAVQMGFTGVGLGKQRAILQVFEWVARNQQAAKDADDRVPGYPAVLP